MGPTPMGKARDSGGKCARFLSMLHPHSAVVLFFAIIAGITAEQVKYSSVGSNSRRFTNSLSLQRPSSKLKSPLFHVVEGALVTNDWCIKKNHYNYRKVFYCQINGQKITQFMHDRLSHHTIYHRKMLHGCFT